MGRTVYHAIPWADPPRAFSVVSFFYRMITKRDIREACGDTYYNRGLHYVKKGQVLACQERPLDDGIEFVGRCRGSHGNIYEQHISTDDIEGFIEIEGECTCPVEYNCKHVAAVLIHWLESRQQGTATAPVDRLLERLTQSCQPQAWAPVPGDTTLLYVLGYSAQKAGQYVVEPVRSRLLKNGSGFGKPTRINSYELHNRNVDEIMQPLDREIRLLLGAASHWRGFRLQGEIGGMLLPKLLQTGRAFWQDIQGPPLAIAEPRELALEWQSQAQGYRLQLQTRPPGGLMLPVLPPYYLDPRTQQLGPLLGAEAFTSTQLEALAEAPVIPKTDAQRLAQRMISELPGLPLPLPVELALKEIKDATPRPVLQLKGITSAEMPGLARRAHYAVLLFDYDGERATMPPASLSTRQQVKAVLRIHRELELEQAFVVRLCGLGFAETALPGGEGVFVQRAEDFSEELGGWRHFTDHGLEQLQAEGWVIEQDSSFQLEFMDAEDLEMEVVETDNHWFDLSLGIDLEGQRVDLLPLLEPLLEQIETPAQLDEWDTGVFVPVGESRWAELSVQRIRPVIEVLFELFDRESAASPSLRLSRFDAARLAELDDQLQPIWRGGEQVRSLGKRLREMDGLPQIAPPQGLQAELRPYQLQGCAWLQFLHESGFGGILADDMGLGKTLQALAHLLREKEQGSLPAPVLIVAPTSLMANWRNEAARFTPGLSVLVLHGPARKDDFPRIAEHDVVLTTYPLLARDQDVLMQHDYHSVILDEAQTIKNPKAKTTQVAFGLRATHRLCLTGTPMENHLGELWSLFRFLAPGFLGDERHFNQHYRTPIERDGNGERRLALQRRVAPFLLRRTKQQVAKELPEKVEIDRRVALDKAQSDLYESVRLSMDAKVREALKSKGLARSHITILDALLKLRQICCDPRLVKLQQARKVKQSAKLELLMEMLPELLEEGRRILLFSQFTSMLGLIEEQLNRLGLPYTKLTGQTRKREQAIERFRSGEVRLFLISLKAGGVGLNLTEADTVIHYDPWWNPAVERQATDRAHRIGQMNTVFVYRLVTENTVEEKILELQQRKAQLADSIYRKDTDAAEMRFSEEDIAALLGPV